MQMLINCILGRKVKIVEYLVLLMNAYKHSLIYFDYVNTESVILRTCCETFNIIFFYFLEPQTFSEIEQPEKFRREINFLVDLLTTHMR